MPKWDPISDYLDDNDPLKSKGRVDKTLNKINRQTTKPIKSVGIAFFVMPFNLNIFYPIHDVMIDATHDRNIRFR